VITPSEQELWRERVERSTGNCFPDSRLHVLRNCVSAEMRLRGIGDCRSYRRLVAESPADWNRLLNRLVNRETSFFRHQPSFTALRDQLLPRLAAGSAATAPLALWSAGCSTGEEAFSLAITAAEAGVEVEVLGSDIGSDALAVAEKAVYTARDLAAVPLAVRRRHFVPQWRPPSPFAAAGEASLFEVAAPLRSRVRFVTFNLLDPATYPSRAQDVIFCQNVLIYFRNTVALEAAAALARCLRPGGFLVLAPGELAGARLPGLETVRLRDTVVLRRQA